jgi:serine/threonine protein kinase
MTPEEYRLAGELFERIRELPEEQRAAALNRACDSNSALRAQVQRLLEADRGAASGGFLEGRAIENAARLLASGGSKLPSPGTVIGNYCIGHRIGGGGMGVVYEGRDLRLQRRVAIKILPQPLGEEGAELVRRFRQEALAVSKLTHPNIVSIFHADFEADCYYIAMEFIEGKTLRQLLEAEPRGLDSKAILEIVAQAASALSAAHEAGIVHRDIKPENIMVRPDGFVKVLDFGLAKLHERPHRPVDATSVMHTRPGQLAGTIQYLSPEQVAGKPVDARSDVFSLGVVAYELSTGVRPFDGPTDGAVFDAILNRNPPAPSSLRATLGKGFDTLSLRALEKDPELRFQTANDMRSASRLLARDSQISSATGIRAPQPASSGRGWWLALAGIGGLALGFLWSSLRTAPPAPLPNRFEPMTFGAGEEIFPNLSPDGKQFIYSSSARGHWDVYLQRTGGSAAINLTADSTADNSEPALSRDGSRIAFRSERGEGGLFAMEATGENPRRISSRGHLPSWSPDGKSIVYCDGTFIMPNDRGATVSRLHLLDLTTNTRHELETGDAVQPNWSPHGQRIAYWGITAGGGNREIFTVAADGGPPVQVTDDPAVDVNPVWAPSGQELYFTSDRGGTMNIWRIRIDERTGRTSGKPEPVTAPAVYVRFLSWSADGDRFLYSRSQNRINLASIEFDKSRLETVGSPVPIAENFNIGNFSVSPDESKIVHDTVGDPHEDLWIVNVDGSGRRKLTSDSFRNRLPAWSPKGDEILFISTRTGQYQEWIIRADGSGLRQLTASRDHVNAGIW